MLLRVLAGLHHHFGVHGHHLGVELAIEPIDQPAEVVGGNIDWLTQNEELAELLGQG